MANQPRPIKYTFDADAKKFSQGAKQVERDLKDITRTAAVTDRALDLDVDVDDSALTILRRRLIEARAQLERDITVNVDLDAAKALRDLKRLDRQIKDVDRQINIDVASDRDMLRNSLDEQVEGAQASAEGGGGLLATAFAVAFGNSLKGGLDKSIDAALNMRRRGAADYKDFGFNADAASAEFKGLEKELKDIDRALDRSGQGFTRLFDKMTRRTAVRGLNEQMVDLRRRGFNTREIDAFGKQLKIVTPSLARVGSIAAAGTSGVVAATGGWAALAIALGAVASAGPLAAVGVAAAQAPILGLVDAYDTLDKKTRKVEIVFGKQRANIAEWAKDLSTNVGLGARDIEVAAAGIQDLLVPQGFSRKAAADITKSVYERGAALAEFSGVDTAQGVEAVNAALLGQTRQLKGLGVAISASDVKKWISDNKREVVGLNEKQATTVATLALIEDKSVDAWKAFQEGGSASDNLLDNLNATMANFKTDAIEGFGGILDGIIRDLGRLNDFDFEFSLADWIAENEDKIRSFFLDIGLMITKANIGILDFSIGFLTGIREMTPALQTLIKGLGSAAANTQRLAGLTLMLSPLTFGVGKGMLESAGATEELANASANALGSFSEFIPGAVSGLEGLRSKVEGVQLSLEELQALDRVKIPIVTELETGSVSDAKAMLAELTASELALIIASIDPASESATDQKLLKLAKKRLAKIDVEPVGLFDTERDINWLTRDRTIDLRFNSRGGIGEVPYGPPSGARGRAMPSLNAAAYSRAGGEMGAFDYAGGGSRYELSPRSGGAATPVNVYLDSKLIASHLEPAGSATTPRNRRP